MRSCGLISWLVVVTLAVSLGQVAAAQLTVDNGETMGAARQKINSNFTELYTSDGSLQSAIDGKAASGHAHAGTYEPVNANLQAHVGSAHAPAAAEENVNADWNATSGDAQIANKPTTLAGYGITDAFNPAIPGPIGGTTPSSGAFTSISANAVTVPVPEGSTGEVLLQEDPVNGDNITGFKAPATLSIDLLYILPSTDGESGQCLKTNGSRVLSWAACQ